MTHIHRYTNSNNRINHGFTTHLKFLVLCTLSWINNAVVNFSRLLRFYGTEADPNTGRIYSLLDVASFVLVGSNNVEFYLQPYM